MPQKVKLSGSGSLNCSGAFEDQSMSAACAPDTRPATASANTNVFFILDFPQMDEPGSADEPRTAESAHRWMSTDITLNPALYRTGHIVGGLDYKVQLSNSHYLKLICVRYGSIGGFRVTGQAGAGFAASTRQRADARAGDVSSRPLSSRQRCPMAAMVEPMARSVMRAQAFLRMPMSARSASNSLRAALSAERSIFL